MKKRSIAAKLGVTALALTLVTTSLSSGTLAKYQTQGQATSTFTVARWDVKATLENADGSTSVVLENKTVDQLSDLLLYETATVKPDTKAVAENYIAPGMAGQFNVVVDTAATDGGGTDVGVQFDVYIKPKGTVTAPTHFRMWDINAHGTTAPTTESELIKMEGNKDDNDLGWRLAAGTIPAQMTGDAIKYTQKIGWDWPYTGTGDNYDTVDNGDAKHGVGHVANSYIISVVLTQVNPTNGPDEDHPYVNTTGGGGTGGENA